MKKTALLLIAVIGVGSLIVPVGAIAAVSLINTNVIGVANTTALEAWVIDDTTSTNYFIQNSSISAASGIDVEMTNAPVGNTVPSALGSSGLKSTSATVHNVTVIDSTITASDGGNILLNPEVTAGARVFKAYGGNGMLLQSVTGVFNNATVVGGDGGQILVRQAGKESSVAAGYGLELQGNSTLHATNSVIKGGNGGEIDTEGYTGLAGGGDGIIVNGKNTVVLDFSNTIVVGGDGGSVAGNYQNLADADGGNALLVGGGATLTVNGGTFIGGKAGTVKGETVQDGKSMDVSGATVTLAGGFFEGGILFSAGDSTLALKNTFQDAPVEVAGTSLKVIEWSDGHLSDVKVSAGTMTLDGSAPFNLGGDFIIGGKSTKAATVKFDSGLVVESGGTLDLGFGASSASNVHAKSGSMIMNSSDETKTGKLVSKDALVLDSGTKWIINSVGKKTIEIGTVFTLASSESGAVTNNLKLADVSYEGVNGAAGWLGKIINVGISTNGLAVEAKYGYGRVDEMLGIQGDVSTVFGQASSNLFSFVESSSPTVSSNIMANLAGLTQSSVMANELATNGLVRTTQATKAMMGNQLLYMGIINSRTHSYLNHERVGYPVSGPGGAGGWDFLRSFSDRAESNINTDGLRAFSDRIEGRYGYDNVGSSMRNAEDGVSLEGLRLPETWQIWGQGYGSSAHQDTINGVAGYDVGTGGAMLGVDKRFNNLMMGVAGGFSQSSVDGYQQNNAKIDSLNVIGYLSTYNENAYMDFNVSYAINNADTEFQSYGYTGNYDASALGFYLGGGYGIALNDWLVLTPEASFMATYYDRDAYNETSSLLLPTKQYDSYDQFSPISTLGVTLTMARKVDLQSYEILMQPEFRVHWMHDFNAEMDSETYSFQGGTYNIETPLVATEENLFKIGAGIRLSKWNSSSTELGLDVDGLFADGYNAYMVSGKIVHRF